MYKYSHGGNAVFELGKADIIDLSANINPLGMPEGVKEAIILSIPDCDHYPDNFSTELRKKIAAYEGIDPDWIFCGNGASDIIFRLPMAVQAKKVLTAAPSFLDYERAAVSCGATLIRHILLPDNGFTLDKTFIEAVQREKPELIFLCNPNNPTGLLTERWLIAELLECCQRIRSRVVIDECFLDFAEYADTITSKVFLGSYKNLIILKSFTKLFALPGIRLGYALCADREVTQNLHFYGADWPVSNLSQVAGVAALVGAETFIKKTTEYVTKERSVMQNKLRLLGYKVFDSKANYVFFQNPYPFDLREELNRHGFRIRSCENFPSLDNSYYRIAVSKAENNISLLSAVEVITEKGVGTE
ncbi:MAG: aminotransferase class I/II-fold pyridoxal phosphate-dependent enzyme [Treponema sp.]|jgi:threonine-phosphate decarboxylase|nr:aminotransferase class I/II-fold pyridoxal phosphate-dependent enzyme [Treponema sp.]